MSEKDDLVTVYDSEYLRSILALKDNGDIEDFEIEDGILFIKPVRPIDWIAIDGDGLSFWERD